jgi:PAS domain S-box-containing protein
MNYNFETYLNRGNLYAEPEEYPLSGILLPLESIWNSSTDGMILINNRGIIVNVNDAFCRLADKNREELAGEPVQIVYSDLQMDHGEDFGSYNFFEEQSIKDVLETRIDVPGKGTKYLRVTNSYLNVPAAGNGHKDTILLLSIFKDITGRKEVIHSQKLLNEIINISHDAIIRSSLHGIIKSWNPGAEKIFGYSKEEISGFSVSFLFSPEKPDEIDHLLDRCRKGEIIDDYEISGLTKDNKFVFLCLTIFPVKDDSGSIREVSIIARDITDKKNIENSLLESRERYRSLLETSPDAILVADFSGKILMANRLLVAMMGFTSIDELSGRSIFRNVQKQDYIRVLHHSRHLLETGRINHAEYTLLDNYNRLIPVEISASITVNSMGMPGAAILVIRDISERKVAEQKLRNSELQFRSVWENSNDGMRLTDAQGNIVAVNRAFCELVEISENELIGKPFSYIYNKKETHFIEESLKVYRKHFAARSFETHKQSSSVLSCGKVAELDVTYSQIDFEKGRTLLLAIFHDITERKKVEEELRKSEKHAAIGKMAAYLSHEIKTPLASIKMNIDILSRSLNLPADKQKSFSIIQKEVKRLNNLLKNVLQFARQVDLVCVNINLYSLLNNIKDLIEPSLKEKQIEFLNNVGSIYLKGDYQKLHTMLLHMIENSIEAVSSGGIIEVYTSACPDYVKLFIKDNGGVFLSQPRFLILSSLPNLPVPGSGFQ